MGSKHIKQIGIQNKKCRRTDRRKNKVEKGRQSAFVGTSPLMLVWCVWVFTPTIVSIVIYSFATMFDDNKCI